MHGCNSGSAILVNAEVDSMGGVVDSRVGIGLKTSPRRAAIEKAQVELRQEYDVREERRRELEFLERGGNPLDFKFGSAASVSVQSTSLTDRHQEQFVTSEAKGSFALAASPRGDSIESSGRLGAPLVCEPNSADNLLLFDGENVVLDNERSSKNPRRRNAIAPSEQSSRMDGCQNAKDSEDSSIFRPYARRNRSRPNHGGLRGVAREGKGWISEINNQKDQNMPSISKPKPSSSNGDTVFKDPTSIVLDMEMDVVQTHETTRSSSLPEDKLDARDSGNLKDNQHNLPSQDCALQNPVITSGGDNVLEEKKQVASTYPEHPPFAASTKPENETNSGQLNGFISELEVDRKDIQNEGQNISATLGLKGLDSESSCTQTSIGLDVNNDNYMCTVTKNADSIGNTMEQTSELEGKANHAGCEVLKETNETNSIESGLAIVNNECNSVHQNQSCIVDKVKAEEMHVSTTVMQTEVNDPSIIKGLQQNDSAMSKIDKKGVVENYNSNNESFCSGRPLHPVNSSNCELPQTAPVERRGTVAHDSETVSSNCFKLSDKAHEDSILEEAQIIEAKRKRIAELSVRTLPLQSRRKSNWDFVLEEMAWLANDFAQERLWKVTAAAQLCRQVAFTSRIRFEEQIKHWRIKNLAHSMAQAVMQFWLLAEMHLSNDDPGINCMYGSVESGKVDPVEVSKDNSGSSDRILETSKDLERQSLRKGAPLAVHGYAQRFLKYNSSLGRLSQAEAPTTPDRVSDSGTMDMAWEDRLTEDNLFYTIPSAAMETYRKSVESLFVLGEKTGSSAQEEVETSLYDTAAEYGSEEIAYDEDEGETSTYYMPSVFEGIKSSKSAQKKHINMKSYTPRSYDPGADLPYGQCPSGPQQSMLMGKRPASLNVGSIPTKRIRTATRQRVLTPFSAGVTGVVQAQAKTDASSGDTNSFQDDQSTLHGESQIQRSMEVESVGEFEKKLPYDCAETSAKPKKKKKAKFLGSAYEQGWQLDSTLPNEQRDYSKKRLESHHFESHGSSALYGQHNVKRPKMTKQSLDNTFDHITPMAGSIPSPAASQMSNMSNHSKLIKLIGGRDRGRKSKALKMSAGQPGSGNPWSLFEDQALVVLVHDMGPNWELVSDAINSTLQFKCIFRKPKECKERHMILMERNAGDGADSAEDSGSSQSYPSTLPGIPKGSARQLFQRLQGPMEEDTLKSHFEKIIKIGHKQHYRRNQNDNQDHKQIAPVHNSHVISVSQVCPNNLNGGFLTPLDLCDTTASTPDVLPHGYQGSNSNGLAISNQGSVVSMLPSSGTSSPLQGSSGMVLGNNLPSPAGPIPAPTRDGRYGVPRTSSVPVDEQQRMQHYNQMLSSRNIQQPSLSVPGSLPGSDRGVRMLPGGNGMGMMCGMNRSMPASRSGFQGIASSSMLSSGSMLSSSMVGMSSPVHMHSGAGPGQGNSMLRPREPLHIMRAGNNQEHQRQLMVPELQMQVTQGSAQGIPAFNGLSSALNNQSTPPPVQPYTGHAQQQHQMSQQQTHLSGPHHSSLQGPNHVASSQQQAYAIRLAKERQLQQQQRYLQHQQHQFSTSGALIQHVQPQSQVPLSSSLQNSSQILPQTSSHPVSLPTVTPSSVTQMSAQHQQKHHLPQHGLSRNPGAIGLTNQVVKQRQRQPQQQQPQQQQFQQPGRHHPPQRQHTQPQQQAKLLKGAGRGNMVHQNLSVDPSHINGLSMPPGSQPADKGDQIMHIMQGQGLYSGSGLNTNQSSKPLVPPQSPNHSQVQQKIHSGPASTSSKQLQHMVSPPDTSSTPSQVPPVPSGHMLSISHQAAPPNIMASNHHEMQLHSQPQSHQKQVNQNQSSVERMLQQNRQVRSVSPNKSKSEPTQVEPQNGNNASQVSMSSATPSQVGMSSATPQVCIDSAHMVPIVSTLHPPWKASEPKHDSNMPNPASPVSSSGRNEPLPPVHISQGLGPRQMSGGFPSHGHNTGAQWQQQLPVQQSAAPSILSQQPCQPQEHHHPHLQLQHKEDKKEHHPSKQGATQHQPQEQLQHLQAGQSNLYVQPSNSKLG
ncbi:chromatin modification-related protein EAF1 B-like [Quillaja saponaria]|uniref:Chromatin modification-related protein EAF1 B-like n=1 Tax=Quillaja saponaria TaxID=32244 RepID=A0AAD7L3B7_QUISA|nr:chromatin modification-related protein EAF1 B-like [Quillaja saponaria]